MYIEIPLEDWEPGDEARVAKLNLSLYGTRDAAQNWSAEFTRTLKRLGFTTGKASPCNFKCDAKELFLSVHGDDFTVAGPTDSLRWFEKAMTDTYEIKANGLELLLAPLREPSDPRYQNRDPRSFKEGD